MSSNYTIKRPNQENEYTPQNIQDLRRCQQDPIYFIENFVMVQHPTKGTMPMKLYDYQRRMIESIHNNKDTIILASRQLGKTTVVAAYVLWLTCFSPPDEGKFCVIASKAMNHATEIMSRIKFAYEELPAWLKPGCKYYSRTSIEFENGSKIKSEATSEKTGRGGSPSFLFIDEIAFISKRVQDEMWASIAPSLSTGGKFVLTSTPNGDTDLFSTLWRGANAGTNSFNPVMALWHEHPERGPAYYSEMVGKLGPVKARQELDCEFLSSDALLISSLKLTLLKESEPVMENMGFKFWKTEAEIGGAGKTYLVGIDPATGNGSDFTDIDIVEFPSLEQIGQFRTNHVNIPLIYAKIKWILKYLTRLTSRGCAEVLWSFERNGVGEALVAMIQNDDDSDGGVYIDNTELFCDARDRLGCYTTGKSKLLTCMQLKNLVEKAKGLTLHSDITIYELKHFVASGGTYQAKPGATDDCVMALCVIIKLLNRLSSYNDDAKSVVYEQMSPDADIKAVIDQGLADDEPVPFAFM